MCLCVNVFKANLETDLLILITCALTVMFNPNPALRNNHTYEASLFSLPSLAHRLSVLKAVQRLSWNCDVYVGWCLLCWMRSCILLVSLFVLLRRLLPCLDEEVCLEYLQLLATKLHQRINSVIFCLLCCLIYDSTTSIES